ncbi:hypothetical protein [Bradyrhizobium sp. 170]|uniref:hypothetical protein n=1 Tax=Bradyrhizobium sp. 170 TaxID=2782641 RepID=UPI003211F1DD
MATDIAAASGELGTVILGARDLRQHALRFDRKNLHLTAAMISLSARKRLIAGEVSQCIDTEAGLILGLHMRRCSKWPGLGQRMG